MIPVNITEERDLNSRSICSKFELYANYTNYMVHAIQIFHINLLRGHSFAQQFPLRNFERAKANYYTKSHQNILRTVTYKKRVM